MTRLTPHTEVTLAGLAQLLQSCRDTGYASCDEEIELGVRSIAIPLHDHSGSTVAALSISTRADRMTTSKGGGTGQYTVFRCAGGMQCKAL